MAMDLRLAGRSSNTYCIDTKFIYISKFLLHLAPHPPHSPKAIAGHLPTLSVLGWGISNFCTVPGADICQQITTTIN